MKKKIILLAFVFLIITISAFLFFYFGKSSQDILIEESEKIYKMTAQELSEYIINGCYFYDGDFEEKDIITMTPFGGPRRLNLCPDSKQLVISKNKVAF